MHLITYTNLYPDDAHPRHGIFVRERLNHLMQEPGMNATVIALRPGLAAGQGKHTTGDISVNYHPVPTWPMISNWIDPWLWAKASLSAVRNALGRQQENAILDAHFLYPDGAAATIIGRQLNVPVVLTARGSDVNVKCANPVMRRWVRWSAANSDALITVSADLLKRLHAFGVRCPIMRAIPNGVDASRFRPLDKSASRRQFNVDVEGEVLLTVGHLLAAKGHHMAIRALPGLPAATLLIAGEGPEEDRLRGLADELGVRERVRFAGSVDPSRMPALYSAADTLILASQREGMPNVILESLACGTPVVASSVGGVPEVLTSPVAGRLLEYCSADAIVSAVTEIRAAATPRQETCEFARHFAWKPRVTEQVNLYRSVLDARRSQAHE